MGRRLKRLVTCVRDLVGTVRWALHERRKAKRRFPWQHID